MFGDDVAAAMINRLVPHANMINRLVPHAKVTCLKVDSYRLKTATASRPPAQPKKRRSTSQQGSRFSCRLQG